jgi:hypothetical protein
VDQVQLEAGRRSQDLELLGAGSQRQGRRRDRDGRARRRLRAHGEGKDHDDSQENGQQSAQERRTTGHARIVPRATVARMARPRATRRRGMTCVLDQLSRA